MVKDCTSKRKCITCNRQNHSSVNQQQNPNSTWNLSSPQKLSSNRPHNSVNRQKKRFAHSLLLYVPVTIRNKHNYINTYGFLDNGSNDDYLLQSISGSLRLSESLETEEFFIDGFHDSKQIKERSFELTIRPFGNLSEQFLVKRAYVLDKLNLEDVQPDKLNIICNNYGHRKDINFPDFDNNQVSILIWSFTIDLATAQAICNFHTSWLENWWPNSRHTQEFSFPSLLFSPQRHQRRRTPFRTTSVNLANGNLLNLSRSNSLKRQKIRPLEPSADYYLQGRKVSSRSSLETERMPSQQVFCCLSTIQENENPPS